MNPESMRPRESSDDRKKWSPPKIVELPRLTDLTLSTGSPIGGIGDTGGGGSSVF